MIRWSNSVLTLRGGNLVMITMTIGVISGPFGRMGQALCRLARERDGVHFVGGLLIPREHVPVADFPLFYTLGEMPAVDGPIVLIDFTEAAGTVERVEEAADLGIPMVIGTTGFSPEQTQKLKALSATIPLLVSANMSLGINLLSDVVERLASRLPDYDIEIIETHHRRKKDAPSGTAILLGEAAAAGRQVALNKVAIQGREGMTGERPGGEIGFHALRGGDVVGDHTVLFAGPGERIEVTHKASSRDTFAAGALFAAEFLVKQKPGFYTMRDALELA